MPATSPEIWTISQLTRKIKGLLEQEIGRLWVGGEISNWRLAHSGHAYFTLKDENSQIDAVIFRGRLNRLRFEPEAGLEVLAQGAISVYERRGNYQIIVETMEPKGVGALQLAFEKLKRKLEAEGLFDPALKKALPLLPRRIGVVTSPTGAAIRDILNVLNRRFGQVHVIIAPAKVQGEGAAAEIASAIGKLDAFGVDAMIVGRGGGSLEDLWAFNEEVVVRAVHGAKTPVISAVGHEIDFSLCDFAADLRAPTPSAAAELVVQEQQALIDRLDAFERRLAKGLRARVEQMAYRLEVIKRSAPLHRPESLLREKRLYFDDVGLRLDDSIAQQVVENRQRLQQQVRSLALLSPRRQLAQTRQRLQEARRGLLRGGRQLVRQGQHRLSPVAAHLEALSPLGILSRGYAVAWKEPAHSLLRDAVEATPKDEIQIRLGRGTLRAVVTEIEEGNDGQSKG